MNIIFRSLIMATLLSCANGNTKSDMQIEEPKTKAISPKDEENIIEPQSELDTLKGSIRARTDGMIGNVSMTIRYYSPAVRGRVIWGGLVAYDNVWVTGAHKATSIEFDHDIKIGKTVVPAGKYAFFTIPSKDQWMIILNKNWNQHLVDDYAQEEDVVRINVVPETQVTHQERLRYVIEPETEKAGEIVIYWEKLEVSVPFEILNQQ